MRMGPKNSKEKTGIAPRSLAGEDDIDVNEERTGDSHKLNW
jgi:hypothetical protein